ncbi:L,D-transpeptidase family protein [Martelella radicis]|uniref:Lipoprotein-anchoring transpeptidase ErfK/SrfK n=1 Tax=Martelella radicis TaxID=1397476 RepID=A0A7W6KID0_9HYPH|nr:L,D-transpeptidase [Martelella radicis]MBB4121846.1 lipoprotein-anchoring transpeptidase ErfK/SrfK [Martelella radicis]
MKKATFYTIPLLIAALALPATGAHAHEPLYKNGQQIFLVAPDGRQLDYIPEYGSVVMGRDARGRPILLDRNGNLVATEMSAGDYRAIRDSYGGAPDPAANGWGRRDWRQNGDRYAARPNRPGAFEEAPPRWSDSPPAAFPQAPEIPAPATPDTAQERPAVRTSSAKPDMNVVALQVFLDRNGTSPGVIDGLMGDNVRKALEAYAEKSGRAIDPEADKETILQSLSLEGGLPVRTYTITAEDAAGPYVASIPSDYGEKAQLAELSYTSVSEMLAEKFHMDEGFLKALNPDADFSRQGTVIKVVNPGTKQKGKVARIIADKSRKQLFAYDAAGALVAAYPATIGSADTPSPSGTVSVERIALDPNYTYDPEKNFKQGDNNRVLTINPGPNGPVGNVWIALSKPSYGIHGTPDPARIGKTSSHGCVRLTNWDAQELAGMVSPGVTVEFID